MISLIYKVMQKQKNVYACFTKTKMKAKFNWLVIRISMKFNFLSQNTKRTRKHPHLAEIILKIL